ncbi:MAG: hypothetical protein AAFP02_06050, partial [Bacteroidota bacterium]
MKLSFDKVMICILMIATVQSCSNQSTPPTEFETYLNSIPEITLPLLKRCDADFWSVDANIPEGLNKQFLPEEGVRTFGKLSLSDSTMG